MTKVTIYKSPDGAYTGIHASGHALYDDAGKDIVCASVSLLTINTLNAIDRFTADKVQVTTDKKEGILIAEFTGADEGTLSGDATLLMQSYEMGVKALSERYKEVRVTVKER